jgi:hypothetical protein
MISRNQVQLSRIMLQANFLVTVDRSIVVSMTLRSVLDAIEPMLPEQLSA